MSDISHEQDKMWPDGRNDTMRLLNNLADKLDKMQLCADSGKVASTLGFLISGICDVSAPFMDRFNVLAGDVARVSAKVGILTSIVSRLWEYFHQKHLMKRIQNALDKDEWGTIKIKKHISRTEQARNTLGKMYAAVIVINRIAASAAKKAKTESKGRLAEQVAGGAERVRYVLSIVLLPLYMYIVFDTCMKIYNGSKHVASEQIRNIASE